MKFTKLIVPAIIGSAMMLSCQKEISPEDFDPIDPPAISDSIYLDMVVGLDSISPTEIDTAYITRFQYDAAKRVISQNHYFDDGGGMALGEEYKYTYNGTDTLPATRIYHMYDYAGGGIYHKDTTTTYYTYSGGKVLKDSSIFVAAHPGISPTDTTVVNYTYAGSQIIALTWYHASDRLDPSVDQRSIGRDTAMLDSRGNVISGTSYSSIDNGVSWQHGFNVVFTYDTRPSPFSLLSNFKTYYIVPPPESYYYDMQTPNNRTSYRYDRDFGQVEEGNHYGMIYNSRGLLSSERFTHVGSTAENIVKYFYKAL